MAVSKRKSISPLPATPYRHNKATAATMRGTSQVSRMALWIQSVLLAAVSCGAAPRIMIDRDAGSGNGDSVAPADVADTVGVDVADSSASNAGDAVSSFALGFPARVRSTIRDAGTLSTCASPLPPLLAATSDDARAAVRQFIAGVVGAAPDQLTVMVGSCSATGAQTCARAFQHDIYKSNGIYGESLFPLAQDLEMRGAFVEETIWVATVNGLTMAADVAISGVVEGTLVGMVMFNDRQDCP
jgi:hypothetical protein